MTQTIHVISHTHWDREWYRPFQIYRARLVDLIDAVLDILDQNPAYRYYHLDGQTIVLDDYLQIRPGNEDRLKQYIGSGRLLVGPWYTQPDEFLVSGESIVRNLLHGRRQAMAFGGCMDIGYLPDSFGHNSQMPQIFKGFGFSAAVVFRGITSDQVRSAFRWTGADETSLLTIKLPDDDAYSNFLYRLRSTLSDPLPIEYARLDIELARLKSDCDSTAVCEHLLWMDGVDHILPNPKTSEIIAYANRSMQDMHVIHSTLPDYVKALQLAETGIEEQRGELRYANRKWVLQAVLANVASSHIEIKQANVAAQNALERIVEPLSTLAWLSGAEYPAGFLTQAWQFLMQNHAHDSICGCSIDQVHRDMHYRYDQVNLISGMIADRALKHLATQVNTSWAESDESVLLIYNPSSWPRNGPVIVDVPVSSDTAAGTLRLVDSQGREVHTQVLAIRESNRLQQARYDIPIVDRKRLYQVVMETSVPPFGFSGYRVHLDPAPNRPVRSLFVRPGAMENEFLLVSIDAHGTVTLHDKQTGRIFTDLLTFEDRGDGGEGWNWVPPFFDRMYTSQGAHVSMTHLNDGELMATIRLRINMQVPSGFTGDAHEYDPVRMRRNDHMVDLPITVDISLGAGSRQIDMTMSVENTARNHRLRVLFATQIKTDFCYADGAFDVVKRAISQVDSHNWKEPQLGTYPHSSFVSVQDDSAGMAVLTSGTHEYEVTDTPVGTIAVTLFRAFGRGAGEPHEYMDSQEIGLHTYHLALLPYVGDWQQADVVRASRQFNLKPLSVVTRGHTGNLPIEAPLLEIVGHGIDVTAVKHAEDRNTTIVRLVNLGDKPQSVKIGMQSSIAEAFNLNLAEERLSAIRVDASGHISLLIDPRKIVTIELG